MTHNDPSTAHDGGPNLRLRTAFKHAYVQMHQQQAAAPASIMWALQGLASLPACRGPLGVAQWHVARLAEKGVWLSQRSAVTLHTSQPASYQAAICAFRKAVPPPDTAPLRQPA